MLKMQTTAVQEVPMNVNRNLRFSFCVFSECPSPGPKPGPSAVEVSRTTGTLSDLSDVIRMEGRAMRVPLPHRKHMAVEEPKRFELSHSGADFETRPFAGQRIGMPGGSTRHKTCRTNLR